MWPLTPSLCQDSNDSLKVVYLQRENSPKQKKPEQLESGVILYSASVNWNTDYFWGGYYPNRMIFNDIKIVISRYFVAKDVHVDIPQKVTA